MIFHAIMFMMKVLSPYFLQWYKIKYCKFNVNGFAILQQSKKKNLPFRMQEMHIKPHIFVNVQFTR